MAIVSHRQHRVAAVWALSLTQRRRRRDEIRNKQFAPSSGEEGARQGALSVWGGQTPASKLPAEPVFSIRVSDVCSVKQFDVSIATQVVGGRVLRLPCNVNSLPWREPRKIDVSRQAIHVPVHEADLVA